MTNWMKFIRQLSAGIALHIPGVRGRLLKNFYQETGGTTNLKYCMQVWARHLSALKKHGWETEGKKVLEIGPGDSLGIGIIQVFMAAKSYNSVDSLNYKIIPNSLRILDELSDVIHNGISIEDNPDIFPFFEDTQQIINDILEDIRSRPNLALKFQDIKDDLINLENSSYQYKYIRNVKIGDFLEKPVENSYDLVFSQSVLEYIENPKLALDRINFICVKGGFSSHEVDLGSMRTSKYWDGHWAYSKWTWNIAMRKRPLFINRYCLQQYLEILKAQSSHTLILEKKFLRPEVLDKKIKSPYNKMDPESRRCRSFYFLLKKVG